jgi:hypothetical protein
MGPVHLLLTIGIAGALGTALWNWRHAHDRIAGTSLLSAWRWSFVAGVMWFMTWVQTSVSATLNADQLWFLTAVLALCPPLSILGAKQPMSRVWTPFVIVPLILVLGWTAFASAGVRGGQVHWEAEEPVIVGFALVLLMTAGNHLTTRFTGPVLLWCVSLVLIVLPVSPVAPAILLEAKPLLRGVSSLLVSGAMVWGVRLLQRPWDGPTPLDRLWREFRDLFGVAWARRIQDRMYDLALQHAWPVRLQPEGFVPAQPATADEPASPAPALSPEQALRWLLRRFADEAWIERRLDS